MLLFLFPSLIYSELIREYLIDGTSIIINYSLNIIYLITIINLYVYIIK